MTSTPRRLLAVALSAAVAAGCGQATSSSSSPPDATSHPKPLAKTLLAAAAATTNTGSAQFGMNMTMTTPQGTLTMRGTGAISFHKPPQGTMTLVMHVPNAPTALTATERILGTTIYMRMPFLTAAVPNTRPWIKIDLQALGRSQGMDLGALMNSGTSDPTAILGYLQGISNDIQNLGTQTVGGVQTTHYRASVSFQRMMSRLSAQNPAAAASIRHMMSLSGTSGEPVEVWIDGQGLLRREKVTVRMPSQGSTMTMVIGLSHFGAPVHVTAPPPSQTSDFQQFVSQAGTSAGA
jgi:hypothetical protein